MADAVAVLIQRAAVARECLRRSARSCGVGVGRMTHVVMLVPNAKRQRSLESHIGGALEEGDKKRVFFLLAEDVPGFLDGYRERGQTRERTVKGYTVRSKVKDTSPEEALARRRAVARVVAGSPASTVV